MQPAEESFHFRFEGSGVIQPDFVLARNERVWLRGMELETNRLTDQRMGHLCRHLASLLIKKRKKKLGLLRFARRDRAHLFNLAVTKVNHLLNA